MRTPKRPSFKMTGSHAVTSCPTHRARLRPTEPEQFGHQVVKIVSWQVQPVGTRCFSRMACVLSLSYRGSIAA